MDDLTNYKVTFERGFLPAQDPARSLPGEFARWDAIGAVLPALLMGGRLRATLDALPALDSAALTDEGHINRAMLLLTVLANAYVWASDDPVDRIPAGVAVPLCEIAGRLDLPPIIAHAHMALHNWQRIDTNQPLSLENIAPLQLFLGGLDEHWFYLLTVAIEAAGGPIVSDLLAANGAVMREESGTLTNALINLEMHLTSIYDLLARMPEQCDPYIFYHRVRPYVAGWEAPGMIYEGVSDEPKQYMGGSAAQSPLIQAIDAGLGVSHDPDKAGAYLLEMRNYMLPAHRRFIRDLESESEVRDFVLRHAGDAPQLADAYNACLKRLDAFRAKHMELSVGFILHQAEDQGSVVGTGGTNFVPFLSQARKDTQAGTID